MPVGTPLRPPNSSVCSRGLSVNPTISTNGGAEEGDTDDALIVKRRRARDGTMGTKTPLLLPTRYMALFAPPSRRGDRAEVGVGMVLGGDFNSCRISLGLNPI